MNFSTAACQWVRSTCIRDRRAEAGGYLIFLATLGCELSPIGRAVADGVAWKPDVQFD